MTARHRRVVIPHSRAPRGTCRWCGEVIIIRGKPALRCNWHAECVAAYKVQAWPQEARRVVRARDHGICAACGVDTKAAHLGAWELDHRIPLIDGGSKDLQNLQTLCVPCHKAKTAREAGERARRRSRQADLLQGRAA